MPYIRSSSKSKLKRKFTDTSSPSSPCSSLDSDQDNNESPVADKGYSSILSNTIAIAESDSVTNSASEEGDRGGWNGGAFETVLVESSENSNRRNGRKKRVSRKDADRALSMCKPESASADTCSHKTIAREELVVDDAPDGNVPSTSASTRNSVSKTSTTSSIGTMKNSVIPMMLIFDDSTTQFLKLIREGCILLAYIRGSDIC